MLAEEINLVLVQAGMSTLNLPLTLNMYYFPGDSDGKASAYNAGDPGSIPGLGKEMATHSSTLAWKIPWMDEHGRLQFMGSQRVGHDWVTSFSFWIYTLKIWWTQSEGPDMLSCEACYGINYRFCVYYVGKNDVIAHKFKFIVFSRVVRIS